MADVKEITDATFEEEVMKSEKPAIVDFWADWCMPCKAMGPVIEEIAGTLTDKVKICKINVDQNTKMATDLGVMNIPTMLFFKDGQEKTRVTGVVYKEDLISKANELLG